jgi:hypothetical protein
MMRGIVMRTLITRLGFIASTLIVALIGPATAIANAKIASNHNEVMVTR